MLQQKLANKESEKLSKQEKLIRYIELLIEGPEPGLITEGGGGISKTFTTFWTLEKHGLRRDMDYAYINGYATPFKIYEALYLHRNKQVIVLDDVDLAIINKIGVQILKAALDTVIGPRIVRWASARFPSKTIEENFEIKAKLIIIANKLPNNADFQAVRDRCINYYFNMDNAEMIDYCKNLIKENALYNGICLTEEEKTRCLNFIISKTDELNRFTVRDLSRIFHFYESCKKDGRLDEFAELSEEVLKKYRKSGG